MTFVIKVPCWQMAGAGEVGRELSRGSAASYKSCVSGQRAGNLLAILFLLLYFWEQPLREVPKISACQMR